MHESPLIARRRAARLLMAPFAALCVAAPVSALIGSVEQEKIATERVAKKLERAKKSKAQEDVEAREALRDFKKAIAAYVELHNRQVARVGQVESEAGQKALAAAIIARRVNARQGDLFLVEIQPLFRQLVAEQLKGPDSLPAQKAVVEGNPGHDEDSLPVTVRVNTPYPRGAARSTVPPSVLATLPPLPECLNYLFVGRNLILVDAKAQLIVDFLPAAVPGLLK